MSDKPTIVEALCAVMRDVQGVSKSQRNPQQNYLFRGIDDVVNAVGPVLRDHGVIVLPVLEKASLRDVQTSTGKPARESVVEVRYRFYGPAGDSIDAVVPGESMDHGDKGIAKAMSVAYRIVLLQALCIPTGDPDPDSQTYEREREEPRVERPSVLQQSHYDDLLSVIDGAATKGALLMAFEQVKTTYRDGDLTTPQANALRARIGEREPLVPDDAPPAATAEPKPGGITKRTQGSIFALFTAIGIESDEDRHTFADQTLKRTGVSFKALTEEDGLKLEAALTGRKKALTKVSAK